MKPNMYLDVYCEARVTPTATGKNEKLNPIESRRPAPMTPVLATTFKVVRTMQLQQALLNLNGLSQLVLLLPLSNKLLRYLMNYAKEQVVRFQLPHLPCPRSMLR